MIYYIRDSPWSLSVPYFCSQELINCILWLLYGIVASYINGHLLHGWISLGKDIFARLLWFYIEINLFYVVNPKTRLIYIVYGRFPSDRCSYNQNNCNTGDKYNVYETEFLPYPRVSILTNSLQKILKNSHQNFKKPSEVPTLD